MAKVSPPSIRCDMVIWFIAAAARNTHPYPPSLYRSQHIFHYIQFCLSNLKKLGVDTRFVSFHIVSLLLFWMLLYILVKHVCRDFFLPLLLCLENKVTNSWTVCSYYKCLVYFYRSASCVFASDKIYKLWISILLIH